MSPTRPRQQALHAGEHIEGGNSLLPLPSKKTAARRAEQLGTDTATSRLELLLATFASACLESPIIGHGHTLASLATTRQGPERAN
mgnify:FL=1